MELLDINPFLRYAGLQHAALSNVPFCRAYDFRLFYILDGQAALALTDRSVPISAGTLIYFRPGTPYYFKGHVKVIVLNFDMTRNQAHKTEPINPLDTLNHFDPSLIFENDTPSELSEPVILINGAEMAGRIQTCLMHFSYPTPYSDVLSSCIVKEILCYIVQKTHTQQSPLPELVQKVMLYIQQNYDQKLSNLQIASEFGYHPYYLNRVFQKCTGMTLHQALIAERISLAKRLLSNTELSVDAVSGEVGFSDRAQFSTAFRKHTGLTPTEYRNIDR